MLRSLAQCSWLATAVLACGPVSPSSSRALHVALERSTIDGRYERGIVKVVAQNADGAAGTGTVAFFSSTGTFSTDEAPLVDGQLIASYRCDPTEVAACQGEQRLTVSWAGEVKTVNVRIGPSTELLTPRWKVVPTGTLKRLNAAAVATDGSIWAVGDQGTVLRYAQEAWAPVATRLTVDLAVVVALPSGSVLVAGAESTLSVFRADKEETHIDGQSDAFTAGWANPEGRVYLTTNEGRIGVFNGTLEMKNVAEERIDAIGGLGSDVWAASNSHLYKNAGDTWQEQQTPMLAAWSTLLVSPTGALWLGGGRLGGSVANQGVVVSGPTPTWLSSVVANTPVRHLSLVPDSAERLALTDDDVLLKLGDEAWRSLNAPSGGKAIVSRRPGDAMVVGPSGFSLLRLQ